MREIRARAVDVRRVWLDAELTVPEAAAQVGMSADALRARADALGLPARKGGRREVIRPHQEAMFREMWAAGISARAIGAAFACSYFAVINTASRLGLPARRAGFRPKLKIAEFAADLLRAEMAAVAAQECARRKEEFRR